jgi:hypothetical protein
LAAASAAFVRAEIMRASSSSATAAKMWIVSLFTVGMSAATNSTPYYTRLRKF